MPRLLEETRRKDKDNYQSVSYDVNVDSRFGVFKGHAFIELYYTLYGIKPSHFLWRLTLIAPDKQEMKTNGKIQARNNDFDDIESIVEKSIEAIVRNWVKRQEKSINSNKFTPKTLRYMGLI